MKYIHQEFPSFYKLKLRFFTTYIWPHPFAMATIYCLLSNSLKDRLNNFYRRCLRIIYHLFECPTSDLYKKLQLPTLEQRYHKSLIKRLNNIEQHEQELIACCLMNKRVINSTHSHYTERSHIQALPRGRPSTRLTNFYQSSPTYFDKLLQFANPDLYHQATPATTTTNSPITP
jgi:hypothetical protein